VPDPHIHITVPAEEWKLLQGFHKRIDKEVMETCSRCNERRFKMRLNGDQVCAAGVKVDRDIDPGEPHICSHDKRMDPGLMPGTSRLPKLTQIEEMLIPRVHCFVSPLLRRGTTNSRSAVPVQGTCCQLSQQLGQGGEPGRIVSLDVLESSSL
jgi:hypothetical protein